MPSAAQLAALHERFPDHLLLQFPKVGHSLARDFKWLGSYRYGILHLGGQHADDLRARCQAASDILQWPLPYAETALQTGLQETSAPVAHPSLSNSTHTPWRLFRMNATSFLTHKPRFAHHFSLQRWASLLAASAIAEADNIARISRPR